MNEIKDERVLVGEKLFSCNATTCRVLCICYRLSKVRGVNNLKKRKKETVTLLKTLILVISHVFLNNKYYTVNISYYFPITNEVRTLLGQTLRP